MMSILIHVNFQFYISTLMQISLMYEIAKMYLCQRLYDSEAKCTLIDTFPLFTHLALRFLFKTYIYNTQKHGFKLKIIKWISSTSIVLWKLIVILESIAYEMVFVALTMRIDWNCIRLIDSQFSYHKWSRNESDDLNDRMLGSIQVPNFIIKQTKTKNKWKFAANTLFNGIYERWAL